MQTFARQKRCLTGLTLTNGQISMQSVNLNMASRLLQSFRLAHLDRSHDAELRHHLKVDRSDNPPAVETQSYMNLMALKSSTACRGTKVS